MLALARVKSQSGSNRIREWKFACVEFTSHLGAQLHIKLMPFNHSSMEIMFGWRKLTTRDKTFITGDRKVSATNSVHPNFAGSCTTVIDITVVTL